MCMSEYLKAEHEFQKVIVDGKEVIKTEWITNKFGQRVKAPVIESTKLVAFEPDFTDLEKEAKKAESTSLDFVTREGNLPKAQRHTTTYRERVDIVEDKKSGHVWTVNRNEQRAHERADKNGMRVRRAEINEQVRDDADNAVSAKQRRKDRRAKQKAKRQGRSDVVVTRNSPNRMFNEWDGKVVD